MRFLVVDDDPVSRLALGGLLEGAGEVREAGDAEEAWQALAAGPRFDLCCSDVRMPGGGGLALLGRVRADAALADLPFVLITAAADRDTVSAAAGLGISAYLLKPFSAVDTRTLLARVLREERTRRCERPLQTRHRLNVGAQGLGAMLRALEQDAARLLDDAAGEEAATELARIRTACLTLGLWGGAAQLARAVRTDDPAQRQAVLRAVIAGAQEQGADAASREAAPQPAVEAA